MKSISRIKSFVPTIALIGAVLPMIVSAQATDLLNPIAVNVLTLSGTLVTIVFVLSIVAFGWGIVKYITAAGDAAQESKARGILTWGVIGMAVAASLFGLVQFLQNYFGVTGIGTLNIKQPTVT